MTANPSSDVIDSRNGMPEFLNGLPVVKIEVTVKTPEGNYERYYKTTPRGGTLSRKTMILLFEHIYRKFGMYPDLCSDIEGFLDLE